MKKTILVLLVVAALGAPLAMAQESPIAIDAGAGLTWSQRFDTGIEIADIVLGLRGGVWGDLTFRISEAFEAGAELGMYYMKWTDSYGDSVFLGDFPLQAKASLNFGGMSLDVLGGILMTLDMGEGVVVQYNALAGGRLCLGSFYVEADYLMNLGTPFSDERDMYPRFVLGYATSVL